MQLKEAEEREVSIKRMHQTMIQALDNNNGGASPRDAEAQLREEIELLRVEYQVQIKEAR